MCISGNLVIPLFLLFGLRNVCVHSVAIFLWLCIHQEKWDPVSTGGLSVLHSLKSMIFFSSSYSVNVPGTEDQQLTEVTEGGQTSSNESVPPAAPLCCTMSLSVWVLTASAGLWHRERGILLSRQGLIKSPFEVNRKIPIDLNRLWSKSLIMRACNNLLIASLCTMVTLDLWPFWRLDSLPSKISTSQSDPLARATLQVLFLSSFSCLKGLSLRSSSAL